MKTYPAKNALLNDVLADAASPAFREEVLRLALAEVSNRNRLRRRTRGIVAAACALVVLAIGARFLARRNVPEPGPDNPLVVHSQPLGAGMLVTTRPAGPGLIGTSTSAVAGIRTAPAGKMFERISDDQLFALLGGRPAALIQRSPAEAELVFLNPADKDGFPVQ